jgi:hypothetical protein
LPQSGWRRCEGRRVAFGAVLPWLPTTSSPARPLRTEPPFEKATLSQQGQSRQFDSYVWTSCRRRGMRGRGWRPLLYRRSVFALCREVGGSTCCRGRDKLGFEVVLWHEAPSEHASSSRRSFWTRKFFCLGYSCACPRPSRLWAALRLKGGASPSFESRPRGRARQRASSPIDRDQHRQAGKRVVLPIPRGGKVSEVGFLSAISRSAGEGAAPDGSIS